MTMMEESFLKRTKTLRRGRDPGRPRGKEMEKKRRAIEAAKLVMNGIGHIEAGNQMGVSRKLVGDVFIALTRGTPEEIAKLESGELGLGGPGGLLQIIHNRTPDEVRRKSRKKPKYQPEVRQQWGQEAAMWDKLRNGLIAICSLPRPEDVMAIAKKNNVRAKLVDEKLMAAFAWITEFSDAWTK